HRLDGRRFARAGIRLRQVLDDECAHAREGTMLPSTRGGTPMRTKSPVLLAVALGALAPRAFSQELPPPERIAQLRPYIKQPSTPLPRSPRALPQAAPDPKLKSHHGPWPVYLAADEGREKIEAELARELDPKARATIELRTLPADPAKLA